MRDLIRFIFSRVFWINLIVALALVAGVIWATMLWLDGYTRHGETFPVPDFSGMAIEELDDFVADKQVRYVIIDSIYDLKKPKGTVIKQTPLPEFQVKQNRKIYLTVIARSKERVLIRNYQGVSPRQAISMLETRGLKADSIILRPYTCAGCVIGLEYEGQPLDSGDMIEKGVAVNIVVGAGAGREKIPLPRLVGKTYANVLTELKGKSLNEGLVLCDDCPDSTGVFPEGAFIYRQNPEFKEDAEINLGMEIDLYLTIDSSKVELHYPVDSLNSENPNPGDSLENQ